MKIGDTIKCHDKDDLINTMIDLQESGIYTDFLYELNGVKGLYLIVLDIEEE